MDRMRWLVCPGAGVLGWIAGSLAADDPALGIGGQLAGGRGGRRRKRWWVPVCGNTGAGIECLCMMLYNHTSRWM
ncbi:MAG: hypothetical protein QJR01_03610 [Kyrpidia sp.]|nr:hypothetical protein [Kyrpidia sp.]